MRDRQTDRQREREKKRKKERQRDPLNKLLNKDLFLYLSAKIIIFFFVDLNYPGTVETCISSMGVYLIRMVRSVETKRMRGTTEKNRKTGRI